MGTDTPSRWGVGGGRTGRAHPKTHPLTARHTPPPNGPGTSGQGPWTAQPSNQGATDNRTKNIGRNTAQFLRFPGKETLGERPVNQQRQIQQGRIGHATPRKDRTRK
eukprot:scaffold798_cov367-Pavlova_lutheri.AAC.8